MEGNDKTSNDWLLLLASGAWHDDQRPATIDNPFPQMWHKINPSDPEYPKDPLPKIGAYSITGTVLFDQVIQNLQVPFRQLSTADRKKALDTLQLLERDQARVKAGSFSLLQKNPGFDILPDLQRGKYVWVPVTRRPTLGSKSSLLSETYVATGVSLRELQCAMCPNVACVGNLHFMEVFCTEQCHTEFLTSKGVSSG